MPARWAAAAGLLLFALVPAAADSIEFELTERLNRTWRSQLVHYEVTAPAGVFHPDSVVLTGPGGVQPVQLTALELWDATPFLKRAKAAFFVDQLEALSTRRYRLDYGPAPVDAAPAGDLKITQSDRFIEIETARIGVRLVSGSHRFDPPVAAAEAPGPILGVRLLDGRWSGAGSGYGETPVAAITTELTAAGPVFADVTVTTTDAGGHVTIGRFRVVGGDAAIEIETISDHHRPDAGWVLTLGGGDVAFPLATALSGRATRRRAIEHNAPFSTSLSAWAGDGWFPHAPMLVRLRTESPGGEIQLTSRNAGAWYAPRPLADMADFGQWKPHTMGWLWRGWRDTRLAIASTADGGVEIRGHFGEGRRHWTLSVAADGAAQLETFSGRDQTAHTPHPRLDEVKDMILAWPDGDPRNPHLLMDDAQLLAAGERQPDMLRNLLNAGAFRQHLDLLGEFDLMRQLLQVAGRYDALINSDQIDPNERTLLRAQAAYLMYRAASPYNWSVERGYCSGNPNMTVSHTVNAGMLALALRDHPLSGQWIGETVERMDFWLDRVIDADGYWPESSHYARVSWANMVLFGIAATRAGVRNYLDDPKYRAAALFYEKTLTPPDPSRPVTAAMANADPPAGVRVNPPYGRGVRFDVWGFGGLLAAATAETDPAFSRLMQWSWSQSGFSGQASHGLAGLDRLFTHRDLPTAAPDWGSEHYPHLGHLLRRRVGTPDETYLLFVSRYLRNADGEIWPADTGMIAKWFAHGHPIASAFPRSPETAHVLMNNRVLLACNWDPETRQSPPNVYQTSTRDDGFAVLPDVEYVSVGFDITANDPGYTHNVAVPGGVPAFPVRDQVGTPPLQWQRQLMVIDDGVAGGRHYLVLRDTVAGGQPTQWHFWTLSEKLGETAAAADRQTFLADRPGHAAAPLRALTGNRFTAVGAFGVDVDIYVAAPVDTPRATLRWGLSSGAYGALGRTPTFQDLLHLQRPDDGVYFVGLVPQPTGRSAPDFASLADGRIMRVETEQGVDYVFMSADPVVAAGEQVRFSGTAGAVRRTDGRTVLSLPAPGSVSDGDRHLESAVVAAALTVAADAAEIRVMAGDEPVTLICRLPGAWQPAAAADAALWQPLEDGRVQATLPANRTHLALRRATHDR